MKTWQLIWRLALYKHRSYSAHFFVRLLFDLSLLLPGLILRALFNALTSYQVTDFTSWTFIAAWITVMFTYIPFELSITALKETARYLYAALLQANVSMSIFKRPGATALLISSGEAITYFRDDVDYIADYMHWPIDMLAFALFAIIAFSIMIFINPLVTIGALIPVLAIIIMTRFASARLERYRIAHRNASAAVTDSLGEMFSAVQAIQLANKEKKVVEHFSKLNNIRKRVALKDLLFDKLLDSVFKNMLQLATGLILILAARSSTTRPFTVGDFTLFMAYLPYLTEFTYYVGILLTRYVQAGVSFKRLGFLLGKEPIEQLVNYHPLTSSVPVVPSSFESGPLETLEVYNLNYQYPHTQFKISDISFRVQRGDFVVITGPLGSGKTTLLRLLLGLIAKDSGEIYWNNQLVIDPSTFFVPPRSAYTPQVPKLFSTTIKENILLGLPEDKVDLRRAIKLALLEPDLEQLPEGLNTVVGAGGTKLSGGQIQRTAAARMLVRNPDLLVFDDISSALDVRTETQLWDNIFAQKQYTCIAVSDRPFVIERATTVITLKDGRMKL